MVTCYAYLMLKWRRTKSSLAFLMAKRRGIILLYMCSTKGLSSQSIRVHKRTCQTFAEFYKRNYITKIYYTYKDVIIVLFSQYFRFTIIRAVAVGIWVGVVHPGKNTRSE